MTTATTTAAEKAAEAEAKAAELRAAAEAEQAQTERRHAAWQAQRDALTPQFWQEQREGFLDRHKGKVDSAWEAFEQAVSAGQSGVAEWAQYREAVLWRHADKRAVDGYFLHRATQAYEERVEAARKIQSDLSRFLAPRGDASTAANMGVAVEEFREMRDAGINEATRILGREFTADHNGVLAALHALPDYIGNRPSTLGQAGRAEADPAPHGAHTYAEAVSKVTEAMATEVVERHQAERRAALGAWLDEQAGAGPK